MINCLVNHDRKRIPHFGGILFLSLKLKAMNDRNQQTQSGTKTEDLRKPAENPFANNQTAGQEIEHAKDKLDREQEFKEAQTERD